MLSKEERKAIERIEDFLTTNIIISISNDNTANSEELKAFISKNEYLAIEFIASMFLKQSKEIEELKKEYERVRAGRNWLSERISTQIATPELFDKLVEENYINKDKIKAKIEEVKDGIFDAKIVLQSLLEKE